MGNDTYGRGLAGVPAKGTIGYPPTDRDPLLTERESTHGSFAVNARVSQELKAIIYKSGAYDILSNVHRESLDMICLKISRVLSGQANHKDHWDDIAGYAKLGAEACD